MWGLESSGQVPPRKRGLWRLEDSPSHLSLCPASVLEDAGLPLGEVLFLWPRALYILQGPGSDLHPGNVGLTSQG